VQVGSLEYGQTEHLIQLALGLGPLQENKGAVYLKVLCSYYVTAICKFALLMYMSEFCCYVMLNV